MKQKSSFFKALGIMLLSVLFATQANAQNLTVTGTVTDNLGPVIGASIQVEGTSNGCITDIDGNYTLPNVPANATLVFSYIGYQTQKIAVGEKDQNRRKTGRRQPIAAGSCRSGLRRST